MSNKLTLIIIFIMIAFLSIMSLQQFERFKEGIVEKELPVIEIPEFKMPEFDLKDLYPEQLKENYKTFISPNKTLKIKYPADWQEIDKTLLEKLNQKAKKYKLKESELLFIAYQKRLIEFPPLLIIQELPLEKKLEEVIKETERVAKEQQTELIVIKKETKNGRDYFEAKYKKENYVLYLKGDLISAKERNYLITVLFLDQFQEEITPQINFIFDSIQVVQ